MKQNQIQEVELSLEEQYWLGITVIEHCCHCYIKRAQHPRITAGAHMRHLEGNQHKLDNVKMLLSHCVSYYQRSDQMSVWLKYNPWLVSLCLTHHVLRLHSKIHFNRSLPTVLCRTIHPDRQCTRYFQRDFRRVRWHPVLPANSISPY